MIEHVGVRHQGAGPVPVDLQPKVAAAHAHPGPLELVEGGDVGQLRGDVADGVVVLSDGLVPVGDLRQEVRAGQLGQLVVGPEDGHVGQGRGKDVVVRGEEAAGAVDLAVPQQVDHEEDVLGSVEVEVGHQYRLPDGRLLSHLHRDEAPARHGHAHRVGRQRRRAVDAPHLRFLRGSPVFVIAVPVRVQIALGVLLLLRGVGISAIVIVLLIPQGRRRRLGRVVFAQFQLHVLWETDHETEAFIRNN